jgi:hypothetical protein
MQKKGEGGKKVGRKKSKTREYYKNKIFLVNEKYKLVS